VRRFPHRIDGGLGGAHQAHDLRVLEFRVVAHQPLDGIGALVAPRNRRTARAFALGGSNANLGLAQLEAIVRVGLGLLDFFAGELAILDWVHTHDAAGHVAIGDALDLQRMQRAKGSDLLE
jgi:hypothetical protein